MPGMLRVDERMIGNAGPHVRVEAQRLAGGHVEALEAAALRRGDGRLQKNFRAAQGFPGAGLDTRGIAAQVDFFTDFDGLDLDAAPASSRIWSVAAMISGPMPSPCATVMGVFDIGRINIVGCAGFRNRARASKASTFSASHGACGQS